MHMQGERREPHKEGVAMGVGDDRMGLVRGGDPDPECRSHSFIHIA